MDKAALVQHWKSHLESARSRVLERQEEARAGMRVDGDHRPANRGERASVTSQGYLAQGLTNRLESLEDSLALLERLGLGARDRVMMGAVVRAESESGDLLHFGVLPGGDETRLEVNGGTVLIVSPEAPLVKAFLGAEEGDEVVLDVSTRKGVWELVSVD